ncbi:response regulator [Paucibacter sp. APW11]|uniref:Response regulator n=1 Tax=Roseateles aquae TaxID=3077235 RepID=A0ABU3PFV6_9BURK|nr:response regulator [Paucibacter sp. APW11]MDT9000796.1 response regulator [Paucibacter sp. APW11]
MNERLPSYTTVEAARLLGISPASVQRWVDGGHLRAWKTVGGHRRIDAASVDEWLAAQREGSTANGSAASNPAGAVAALGTSVLLVDDDPIARELLEVQVRMALPQARITLAENGFQALLAVGRQMPDVVITDMVMPHMNGVEMLRQLMAEAAPRRVIAVSSQSREGLARLGALPPAVLLLAKPVDQQALSAALQGL